MDLASLPVLGVGASLSLQAKPDATALAKRDGGPSFVEYAGNASFELVKPAVDRLRAAGVPVLFHPSYLNFCGSTANPRAWLEATRDHVRAVGSAWLAQDVATCFIDAAGYSSQLGFFLPPLFTRESLARAIERVREVQAVVDVPILVEPPPMTFVAGRMPLLSFFGALAEGADCGLLLDVGHLCSYVRASGRRIEDEIANFPCERVIEVHVAGGRLVDEGGRTFYVDAHERPILEETWEMFDSLLPKLPILRAVCFECEGIDEDGVLRTLDILRKKVRENSAHPALVERA